MEDGRHKQRTGRWAAHTGSSLSRRQVSSDKGTWKGGWGCLVIKEERGSR